MNLELEDDILAAVMGRSAAKADSSQAEPETVVVLDETLFADKLYQAAKSVLSTMCGMEVGSASTAVVDPNAQRHSLSGLVSISGAVKATIVINLPTPLALKASAALLGSESKEVDGDVIDAIAELANMIGGNTKNLLKIQGAQLSIPTVVKGPDHSLLLASNMRQWGMDLDVADDSLRLEFILSDK